MYGSYTGNFSSLDIAAATTNPFLQIVAPATCAVEIVGVHLGQQASETSNQEVFTISRRTAATTMSTAFTFRSRRQGGGATDMAATSTTNAYTYSSSAGAGQVVQETFCINHLTGLWWFPPADARITIEPAGIVTLEALTTFQAATWAGFVVIRELS